MDLMTKSEPLNGFWSIRLITLQLIIDGLRVQIRCRTDESETYRIQDTCPRKGDKTQIRPLDKKSLQIRRPTPFILADV
jgi:hypothetical protein